MNPGVEPPVLVFGNRLASIGVASIGRFRDTTRCTLPRCASRLTLSIGPGRLARVLPLGRRPSRYNDPRDSRPARTPESSMVRVSIRRALPLLALAALAGCQPEAITTYRVPHVQKAPPRLLGAIAPVGESVWFLKLTGPAPEVAA